MSYHQPANAQQCIDTDGDGWGWNGTSSCLIGSSPPATLSPSTPSSSAECIDTDGDGWGWDGVMSCRIGGAPTTITPGPIVTAPTSNAECIDTDGDGWGWNGVMSCRLDSPPVVVTPTNPPVVVTTPTDPPLSSTIRSTLASTSVQNRCTFQNAQENFSDIRVGDFILHNNAWNPNAANPNGSWSQCISTFANGDVGWQYDWGDGNPGANGRPSGDFNVRSYPELIFGVKDEFRISGPKSETGLPVRVSNLPSISINYRFQSSQFGNNRLVDASATSRFPNGTTINGERNVAIESFFYNADANGECTTDIVRRTPSSNHTYEVMLWLDSGAERLPSGPNDEVTDIVIDGEAYKVFTKSNDDKYVAFVAQNPRTSGTIQWDSFINWARMNAHQVQGIYGAASNSVPIQNDWCLGNILVGTEIFWGAGDFDLTDWQITQIPQ